MGGISQLEKEGGNALKRRSGWNHPGVQRRDCSAEKEWTRLPWRKKAESALEKESGETAQVTESERLPCRKILPCLLVCRAVQGNV